MATPSDAALNASAAPASHPRTRPFAPKAGIEARHTLRLPTVLVACALGVAIIHVILLLSDYQNVFVHPDFHQANLGFVMRSGLAIGPNDFIDILQQREVNEFRPRWLMFYLETLDHKLRMWLYQSMPVYPTLGPVTWPLQLFLTPFLLYKLLTRLTADRLAALAAVAVYMSSNGFLSGFTMALMPGKTLSNLIYVAAFYAAVVAAQRLRPGQMLIESGGPAKYLLVLVLTLGLFLDELPVAAFLVVPVFMWRYFVPERLIPRSRDIAAFRASLTHRELRRFVVNGMLLATPVLIFAVLVLVVAPVLTQHLLGYRFDYLSEVLFLGGNTRTGTGWLNGPMASLTPGIMLENVTTLFGISLVPRFISPLVPTPWTTYPGSQETGFIKLFVLLGFGLLLRFVARRLGGRPGTEFRAYLAAMAVFLVFLCLLSVRHIPVVTGFYYGAPFASLFAILIGMLLSGLSAIVPKARPFAALAVVAIVATQIVNFGPINDGWRYLHNEEMGRARLWVYGDRWRSRYPIMETEQPLTRTEVERLWRAWKRGQLQPYVKNQKFSAAAGYLIVELREIDRQRRLVQDRRGGANDDD
jgi:hypothetical protein